MSLGMGIITLTTQYYVMMLGQIIFGLGGMNMYLTVASIVVLWFKGQPKQGFKTAFTIGLIGFWLRMASVSAYNLLPIICETYGFRWAIGFVTSVCILSFICSLLYAILDKRPAVAIETKSKPPLEGSRIANLKKQIKLMISSLPAIYWCLSAMSGVELTIAWTFIAFGTTYLNNDWGYSPQTAARIQSLMDISYGIGSPICGFIIGYIGRRTLFAPLGAILLVFLFLYFAFVKVAAELVFVLLGLVMALYDAIVWPGVSLIVPPTVIGLANAVNIWFVNVGLLFAPTILGVIYDSVGYFGSLMTFAGLSIVLVLITIWFKILVTRAGKVGIL